MRLVKQVPLLNNNNQQPINIEKSGDVMKLLNMMCYRN